MSSLRETRPISEELRNLAENLHLDIERLERGETIQTHVLIATPQDFKKLLAVPVREEAFDVIRTALDPTGLRDDAYHRGLRHFAANVAGLTELGVHVGKEFFDKRFPMRVMVVAATEVTVTEDISYNPESSPVYIACDVLTFDGGSYTVMNTSFTLYVNDQLRILPAKPGRPYHIAILGAPGGAGAAAPNEEAQDKAPNGKDAPVPTPGICTGAGSGGDGVDGKQGYDGTRGNDGEPGVESSVASLNIAHFAAGQGPLIIHGMSGEGGDGGKGGNGGQGQDGGDGGDGCSTGCEGTDGGDGGDGGRGGNGGNGGDGQRGVNGWPIYLNIDPTQKGPNFFVYSGFSASGGHGGRPGDLGLPGTGGEGGKGGHGSASGKDGNSGGKGSPGVAGSDSVDGAAPPLIEGRYVPPGRMKLHVRMAP